MTRPPVTPNCVHCNQPEQAHYPGTRVCPTSGGLRHRDPDTFTPEELRADGQRRTPKQKTHLLFARLMWYQQMDARVRLEYAEREIDRQLRLAKATREDL